MPILSYDVTNAAAARLIAAYRRVPDAMGNMPAANATNAELWTHVKRVVGQQIRTTVRDLERDKPDNDLDGLSQ